VVFVPVGKGVQIPAEIETAVAHHGAPFCRDAVITNPGMIFKKYFLLALFIMKSIKQALSKEA
jgi:hypothetical protein